MTRGAWLVTALVLAVGPLAAVVGAVEPDAPPAGSAARRSRLYVANTESSSISVIDHADQKVIATIDLGGVSPHGHAPSSKGDRIYASTDNGSGEVIAIDSFTNSILWCTKVGSNLNEPHLTRDDRFLYAPDLLAGKTVIVDVEEREKVGEIEMESESGWRLLALHHTYASYDGKFIYVTSILNKAIARIDVATRKLDRLYRLDGQPRPAAITKDDAKMYVQLSDLHGFVELDLASGRETARISWPEPADARTGWRELLLATKCHGIGITPDGHELWAATNLEGAVYFYSLPDLKQIGHLKIGNKPNWIAFSGDGTTGYVTNNEDGTVSVVRVATHELVNTIPVGKGPKRIHLLEVPVQAAAR